MVEDCKCKSCGCGTVTIEEMISMIDDQTLPFTQTEHDGYIIRVFDPKAPSHLYKWHFDEDDRTVQVLEDCDWQFQYDNALPILITKGVDIFIPKGVYHRLIPGTTPLSLKIIAN